MAEENQKFTYFQYFKELEIPVYIRVDLSEFGPQLLPLMMEQKFTELTEIEKKEAFKDDVVPEGVRVLNLTIASHGVSKHIEMMRPTDKYGLESLIPKTGYKVYRYFGVGMMVTSFTVNEWNLGCYENFGEQDNLIAYRSMMNRFLSWSLSTLGIVGFWAAPVDEGMVVLSQAKSCGEVVFIDAVKDKILTVDGVKKISNKFCIMRLSETLRGKNIEMKKEELVSFLYQYCSYLDYQGLPIRVRQMIQLVAKKGFGLIHPSESFKPRTDLSL
ncbi:MAG: hypothetical protein HN576_10740 [Bacteriovoracaceae bacterium]|jgi:hypothetical protein|nr:hypothetical protein [Bacteriovoracaceae bacterium]